MKSQTDNTFTFTSGEKGNQIAGSSSPGFQKMHSFFETLKTGLLSNLKSLNDRFEPVISKIGRFIRRQSIGFRLYLHRLLETTRTIGFTDTMGEYEKRKLGIFNLLNLLQFCTGLIVPMTLIVNDKSLSVPAETLIFIQPLISMVVLYLNVLRQYSAALITYFILYPFFTSLIYINGMNMGLELFFVLYGIMSVFFLQQISHILFCIGFSMVNYFMLAVVLSTYRYDLEHSFRFFYLLNQLMAIGFIFYGLYLIKKENSGYQYSLISTNEELELRNKEIRKQKEELAATAALLEEQAQKLKEIDSFKTRLFSIVSHDLKSPLYALKNLFSDVQQKKIDKRVMNKMIPQVVKDLHYVTGLTDNLLHWAKSQMQAAAILQQDVNISELVNEVYLQQRLQAEMKGIRVSLEAGNDLLAFVDRNMISLVIRNILSNAIKFTPNEGTIQIVVTDQGSYLEILIADSGAGIDEAAMKKIMSNSYYSTNGTANETGTGLGLMLVKEFLEKNGGQLFIESKAGSGTTFSFTLPKIQTG